MRRETRQRSRQELSVHACMHACTSDRMMRGHRAATTDLRDYGLRRAWSRVILSEPGSRMRMQDMQGDFPCSSDPSHSDDPPAIAGGTQIRLQFGQAYGYEAVIIGQAVGSSAVPAVMQAPEGFAPARSAPSNSGTSDTKRRSARAQACVCVCACVCVQFCRHGMSASAALNSGSRLSTTQQSERTMPTSALSLP